MEARERETAAPSRPGAWIDRVRRAAARRRPDDPWLCWAVFVFGALACGCLTALLVQLVALGGGAALSAWLPGAESAFDLTCLLYGAAVFVLASLTGRLWAGLLLSGGAGLLFALANYIKTVINGSPISIEDFRLLGTLGNVTSVAGTLPVPGTFWLAAAVLALAVLALALFSPALRIPLPARFLGTALGGFLLCVCLFDNGAEALAERFGVDIQRRQTAEVSYAEYGVTVGLWRDARTAGTPMDDTYGAEYMDWVLQEIDRLLPAADAGAPAEETPNVVLLLDEAFFDISTLPGVTYSADPAANYHALQSESLTGDFFSGYLGYGTGYVEMGVLTGFNSRFFETGTNICFLQREDYGRLFSAVQMFRELGYTTASYHTFNNSLYNRTVTFPAMGFEEGWYLDDMPDYWTHGAYVADDYLMDRLIARFGAETAAGNRVFLYGITMENHQPYVAAKFSVPSGVTASAAGLSDDASQILQCLTDGVVYADRAVGKLVEYFKGQDEPVLVVLFGDHRPNLSVSDTENLYTDLGLNESPDVTQWSLDQLRELYTTDFLAWSNVPGLLDSLAGTQGESSYTTLGAKLLSLAGVEQSRYWALVELASEVSLVDSDLYFADGGGNVFWSEDDAGLTPAQQEVLTLLRAVVYDACCGEQYITAAMNQPAGSR